jgi:hypothetical protein
LLFDAAMLLFFSDSIPAFDSLFVTGRTPLGVDLAFALLWVQYIKCRSCKTDRATRCHQAPPDFVALK